MAFYFFHTILLSLLYSCFSWQWDVPSTHSYGPNVVGHTLTTFTTRANTAMVVICGGVNELQVPYSQCIVLDPYSWTFRFSFPLSNPRVDHVAVQVGRFLVIASGVNPAPVYCDVIDSSSWTVSSTGQCDTGDVPAANWGSTLVTTSNGLSILFGGCTGNFSNPGHDNNYLFVLDGKNAPAFQWSRPTLTGDSAPPPGTIMPPPHGAPPS